MKFIQILIGATGITAAIINKEKYAQSKGLILDGLGPRDVKEPLIEDHCVQSCAEAADHKYPTCLGYQDNDLFFSCVCGMDPGAYPYDEVARNYWTDLFYCLQSCDVTPSFQNLLSMEEARVQFCAGQGIKGTSQTMTIEQAESCSRQCVEEAQFPECDKYEDYDVLGCMCGSDQENSWTNYQTCINNCGFTKKYEGILWDEAKTQKCNGITPIKRKTDLEVMECRAICVRRLERDGPNCSGYAKNDEQMLNCACGIEDEHYWSDLQPCFDDCGTTKTLQSLELPEVKTETCKNFKEFLEPKLVEAKDDHCFFSVVYQTERKFPTCIGYEDKNEMFSCVCGVENSDYWSAIWSESSSWDCTYYRSFRELKWEDAKPQICDGITTLPANPVSCFEASMDKVESIYPSCNGYDDIIVRMGCMCHLEEENYWPVFVDFLSTCRDFSHKEMNGEEFRSYLCWEFPNYFPPKVKTTSDPAGNNPVNAPIPPPVKPVDGTGKTPDEVPIPPPVDPIPPPVEPVDVVKPVDIVEPANVVEPAAPVDISGNTPDEVPISPHIDPAAPVSPVSPVKPAAPVSPVELVVPAGNNPAEMSIPPPVNPVAAIDNIISEAFGHTNGSGCVHACVKYVENDISICGEAVDINCICEVENPDYWVPLWDCLTKCPMYHTESGTSWEMGKSIFCKFSPKPTIDKEVQEVSEPIEPTIPEIEENKNDNKEPEAVLQTFTTSEAQIFTEKEVESITELDVEISTESITEVDEMVTESIKESITESIMGSVTESIMEIVTEKVTESIPESVVESVLESTLSSMAEQVTESQKLIRNTTYTVNATQTEWFTITSCNDRTECSTFTVTETKLANHLTGKNFPISANTALQPTPSTKTFNSNVRPIVAQPTKSQSINNQPTNTRSMNSLPKASSTDGLAPSQFSAPFVTQNENSAASFVLGPLVYLLAIILI
ncbi:uncharacterized protein SPAPADRAFT_49399 [Spathaspora passalidarum NRRL Y-27907]|uniref:Uncharacterized protein n=1 Tax=Spathaspora passalidarum (strain NRRL Y-27907 / 11-Y1) TaxID=619300 RepID=G3AI37_SPAPN|nr:uncharacterized protein SPAPADRAFT_49399 [Spathaspora passalidarum NRRL Y-27907]EGW34351.1 hypothetical protein SPAPADRAFT_49399 [Spathaspora passalidarum NRRL Y-27907]